MQSVQQTYVFNQTAGVVTETVNGNWLQAYCEYLGVTQPVNSSWLQALCINFGITQPLYGSWTIALANYYGITQPENGTWWYALANAAGVDPTPPFIWGLNTKTFGLESRVWNIGTPVAPTADFTSNTTSIFEGEQVQFTDTSTGVPTSWAWAFTGGTPLTSNDQNPLIQYDTAGLFTVSLEATNAQGSNTKTVTNYLTVAIQTDLIWDTTDTDWNLVEDDWLAATAPAIPTFDQEGQLLSSPTPTFTGTADPTNSIILTINGTTYNGVTDGLGVWSIPITTALPGAPVTGQNYSVDINAKDVGTGLETSIVGSVNILQTSKTLTFEMRSTWSLYWYAVSARVEQETTPGVWNPIEYDGNPFAWANSDYTGTQRFYKTDNFTAQLSGPYGIRYSSFDPSIPVGASQEIGPAKTEITLDAGYNYRIVSQVSGSVTPNPGSTNYGRFCWYTVKDGATTILPEYPVVANNDSLWDAGTVQQTFTL